MMLRYKSDFPNQVHQLNVSLSKHYFLLEDDSIKWHSEELNINWSNYCKTGKRHLVTFIIRDHFSNCFYAELHSVDKMPLLEDFLFNAWTKKKDYEFHGMPVCLVVPKITQEQFPSINNFYSRSNGKLFMQTPTSGFSSAVVSIRRWEQFIKFFSSSYHKYQTLTQFQENIQQINRETNTIGSRKRSDNNLKKWLDNNPKIIDIGNDKVKFSTFFKKI